MSPLAICALFAWAYCTGLIGAWALRDLQKDDPRWTDYPTALVLSQAIPVVVAVVLVAFSPIIVIGLLWRVIKRFRSKP